MIEQFFVNLASHTEMISRRRAEARAPHSIPVGAIIRNSWGYDQTNIDFYEVVKTSKNFVWLQALKQTQSETGFMCGKTSAVSGTGHGEITQHKVSVYEGRPTVNFKFGCGSLWKGEPENNSWYA